MRALGFLGYALGLAVISVPVLAASANTVRSRIVGYRELGAAFKATNDGLRGDVKTVLIQQSARQIRAAARQQYSWFPAGSGAKAGVKTAAKANIWSNPTQFKTAQDNFARQAEAFQKAANGGDAVTIRIEARKLGATCKACHDQFRVPSS